MIPNNTTNKIDGSGAVIQKVKNNCVQTENHVMSDDM